MGIRNIVEPWNKQPEEKVPDPIYTPKNKKYRECLQLVKWMEDGTFLPVEIDKKPVKFYTDTEYKNWVLSGGPDSTFKDPEGEYFVLRKWEKR